MFKREAKANSQTPDSVTGISRGEFLFTRVTNRCGKCNRKQRGNAFPAKWPGITPDFHQHKMRTRCGQCRKLYHWTLSGCPCCLRPNDSRPAIVFLKILSVVALCAAIIVSVRIMNAAGGAGGVVQPMPDD